MVNPQEVSDDLEKLIGLGLVEIAGVNAEGEITFQATEKGRQFYDDNRHKYEAGDSGQAG